MTAASDGIHRIDLVKPACYQDPAYDGPKAALVDEPLRKTINQLCKGELRWPLFLHGAPGSGKTFAARAIALHVRQCAYRTVDDVATDIVSGREDGWFFSAYDSDLIVLDELGEAVNALHIKAIKKTLDIRERYWDRSGIYISNHDPEKLAGLYDVSERGRIGSRLLCGTVYHLDGPDRRQQFA
jgi:DNA replication protein DnaC